MDHREKARGAKEAIDTVKTLITKECYKDASECIQMAMKLYPSQASLEKYGFGLLIISETLHYGDIYLSKCGFESFDCYSILHLPPSSTQAEVEKRSIELRKEVINLNNNNNNNNNTRMRMRFPGVMLADFSLRLAHTALSQSTVRSNFDRQRKDCVLLDWPMRHSKNKTTCSSSLRESYLDWKPPIYRVEATEHVQLWKKLKLDHLSPSLHQPEEEEEEEEEGEDSYLTPELRILKRKVFDEMPQNPNYTPLEKYSRKVREGMVLGLELAFTKLCDEIRNLVELRSFWLGLDGFNEQISQLKEMGFNVEKVCQRIHYLQRIGMRERTSRAVAEKFEDDVRDREAKVINLQSRISQLQAEIEESKDIIANRKSKIETLKKDSSDAVAKFASIAKSKWV